MKYIKRCFHNNTMPTVQRQQGNNSTSVPTGGLNSVPGSLFDDVLEEDESGVQSALDLLQEEEDLLVV